MDTPQNGRDAPGNGFYGPMVRVFVRIFTGALCLAAGLGLGLLLAEWSGHLLPPFLRAFLFIVLFWTLAVSAYSFYGMYNLWRREEKLASYAQHYKTVLGNVLDCVGVGVDIVSPEYELLSLNQEMRRRYADVDISERPCCFTVFNQEPIDSPCEGCPVEKVLADRRIHEAEREFTRDGKRRHVHLVASPISDPDGNLVSVAVLSEDVTMRANREQELSTERNMARRHVEIAQVILLGLNRRGEVTLINHRGCNVLGYGEDELTGRSWFETCVPRRLRAQALDKFQELLEMDPARVQETESFVLTKAAEERIVHWRATPLVDEGGSVVGVLASGDDVTEEREAEWKLKGSEEKFHSLYSMMNEGVCLHQVICDASGKPVDYEIIDVNNAYEDLTGLNRREVIGKKESELFEGAEQPYLPLYSQVARTGKPGRLDMYIPPLQKHFNVSVFRFGEGKLATVLTDLTERIKWEEKLRAERNLLRTLLNNLPDFICLKDSQGRYIMANRAAKELLGVDKDAQLEGKTEFDFFPDEVARRSYDREQQVLKSGHPLTNQTESFVDTVNDQTRWLLTTRVPLNNSQGQVRGLICISHDITEIKQAEEERQRLTEHLQRSCDQLQTFAHVLAHDLKEPARVVDGFLQLIDKRYGHELNASGADFINRARKTSRRMQEMIQDLLEWVRLDSTGGHFKVADCNQLLEEAIQNLQVALDESDGEVTHEHLPAITADAPQLREVFQNLIENALKFHGEDPPRVHISAERRDDKWDFSLRDNGIGIPPEDADTIFRLFRRGHPREDYPGTGAGLAICERIIERHNGEMWVEAGDPVGSVFHFTLPALEGQGERGTVTCEGEI